jgi:hypothetical protein
MINGLRLDCEARHAAGLGPRQLKQQKKKKKKKTVLWRCY